MKRNGISAEEAREAILSIIKFNPIDRKELIRQTVLSLGFTKEDLNFEEPGGNLNLIKVKLGSTLNQLIRTGSINELDDGQLKASGEELDRVKLKIEVEEIILSLTDENSYTKEDLLNRTAELYFNNHPKLENNQNNKNAVRGYAGNFIKTAFIPKSGNRYGKVKESLRKQNERYLNTLSPEEFEVHSVKLLESYYKKFVYKNDCVGSHCGGNDDGGIDGYLTVTDKHLGCVDKIYIQVKQKKLENKNAKQNTIHEVREFGGILSTRLEALKGIFVTNINYMTKKFIEAYKLKPIIFINGTLWLDLADKCKYSISDNKRSA